MQTRCLLSWSQQRAWDAALRERCRRKGVRVRAEEGPADEAAIQQGLEAQDDRDAAVQQQAKEYKAFNATLETLAAEVREGLAGTSIYLVGMMGSGKSTVGKLAARALKYPFLDSDQIAQAHDGRTISEIFEAEGEEGFRELESAVLQELMPFKACIVSTGGGVVLRRQNWGYMQHGIVVWLDGPPELLAKRACQEDTSARPLLDNSSAEQTGNNKEDKVAATTEKLKAILDKRKEQYAQADIRISLHDNKGNPMGANVSVVAQRLLKALSDRLRKDKKQEPENTPPPPPKRKKEFKGFGNHG